jgi:anaerobic magnesium-protoporphyrin IX monomethyl ester cyclase
MYPRTLLITPPYHAGVVESAGRWPPLGLLYIAGALRQHGYEAEVYDAMSLEHSPSQIRQRLEADRPHIVATAAYTSSFYSAVEVLRIAKEVDPSAITVLGGVHPTFCYEDALRGHPGVIDFIVRGEGEITMVELVAAVAEGADGSALARVAGLAFLHDGSLVVTPTRPFIPDLDSVHPAWELVPWEDYRLYFVPGSRVATVSSSRGCIHECGFCSQQKFWCGTYRQRSPEGFLGEIDLLYQEYGVNTVLLTDEFPTQDRPRWERILEGLIRRKYPISLLIETCVEAIVRDADIMDRYREAGILHIYVGVEATRQERLDRFKKDIRCEQSREAIRLINEAGLISECSFILGVPEETETTIEETLELAKHYDPHYAHFLLLAPWPYADIYPDVEPYIEVRDLSRYNLVEPVIRPRSMGREELFSRVLDCYRRFYMWKLPQWFAPTGIPATLHEGDAAAVLPQGPPAPPGGDTRGGGEIPRPPLAALGRLVADGAVLALFQRMRYGRHPFGNGLVAGYAHGIGASLMTDRQRPY